MKTSLVTFATGPRVLTLVGALALSWLAGLALWRYGLPLRLGAGLPYMPHGHCYLWNPPLLWLHVVSDAVIGISYMAIAATLAYLVTQGRKSLPFHWMMLAFAAFIVACGGTHLCEVLTVWLPYYWFSGGVKVATAVASLATALFLPPLVPKIFRLLEADRVSNARKKDLEAAHAELEAAYERIKKLDALRAAFFANASHELRTPLALILGLVEKLLARTDLDDSQRYNLSVVQRNALQLHKLVNDLLDLSKLEAEKLGMNYTKVDLAGIVRLSVAYFESMSKERLVQLSVDVPELLIAEVDSEKTERILLNLLSNAFKFTPQGGTIRCSLRADDDGMGRITVEDSGPGIPPGLRAHVFERFAQGDPAASPEASLRFGGTGLGLSIVKEFTKMHLGGVTVGDASLGGARFEVRLPLRAPGGVKVSQGVVDLSAIASVGEMTMASMPGGTAGPIPAPVSTAPAAADTQKERGDRPVVLVAEDNAEMNLFITGILRPEFETISAENGAQAFELAVRHKPDLVVSDVMMPEMSGRELLWRMRAESATAAIPVILLTAKVDEAFQTQSLQAGAQDYIRKPFGIDEFRARVRNQVTSKKARDVLQETLASQDQDIGRLAEEITRRTRDLQTAKEAAEEASQAKDRFLAILSHELRTPLMPVLTGVLELESDRRLQPDVRDLLGTIRRNVEMEARLIDDLLDLTRVAKGKLQVQFSPVDVHQVLLTAVQQFDSEISGKFQRVAMRLEAAQHWTNADAPRLLQIFGNLIGNAVKFTPNEGKIEISTRNNDAGQLLIKIRDTGIGIAPPAMATLFKPFEQVSDAITRRYGGLGLGLAVSKALVEAQGGVITAESPGIGLGSVFTLSFPAIAAAPPVAVSRNDSAKSPEPEIGHTLHILLVEDHEDTRITLARLIKRWGYEVDVADSVAKALEIARSGSFDLLISDLGLPDGAGTDLIRQLRQERRADGMKAVAVSGFGMEEDIRRSHEAGFDEHLTKPIAVGRLREAIERLVGVHQTG